MTKKITECCIFCNREFTEHSSDEARVCIDKLVSKGVGG